MTSAQHRAEKREEKSTSQLHHGWDLLAHLDKLGPLSPQLTRSAVDAERKRQCDMTEGRKGMHFRDAMAKTRVMEGKNLPHDPPKCPHRPARELKT